MKTTVPVFITGVSFPKRDRGGADIARALVHVEDDACTERAFAFGVPPDFARELSKALDDEEDDGVGQLTIAFGEPEGWREELTEVVFALEKLLTRHRGMPAAFAEVLDKFANRARSMIEDGL